MLIDSHCHLDFPELAQKREAVLSRARDAGLVRMVNICTKRREFDVVTETAAREPDVFCTVGVHPHHVSEPGEGVSVDELVKAAMKPKVIGIGETGLDYFYDTAPRDVQEASFRTHIRAAEETGLPLVIHSREAESDTIRILRDEAPVMGVLHCFSSNRVLAEEGLRMGLYISVSGILTFKKSSALRDIIRDVPLDRLLVETDAPFLAPEPLRGKTCEPAHVALTAQFLADVKDITFVELQQQTMENFFRLFTKCPQVSA